MGKSSDNTDPYLSWLNQQSKEQLVVFVANQQYTDELNADKLLLLTGCSKFGDIDGMDGVCVDCYYNDRILNERCHLFSNSLREFRKSRNKAREELKKSQS